MSVASMMSVFSGLMVMVAILSCDLRAQELRDGHSAVLFRKAVGRGEITCTAGPNQEASLLDDLWGKEATSNCLAVYEFHVDWHLPNSRPIRLWSTVFGVGKRTLESGRIEHIEPGSPESKRRVGVMDAAIVTGGELAVPPRVVLAMRSPSGSGFWLHELVVGGEASSWMPAPDQWTAYDTPTTGDPGSIALSISPDGLCRAEVVSMRRHTVYRQIAGKWDFEIERQWVQGDAAGK